MGATQFFSEIAYHKKNPMANTKKIQLVWSSGKEKHLNGI